ncbi:hypothetical protein A1353_16250 [Methylomonas methanica]|uniref:Transglycosylase SLT domain-containing protein n=1 Tax=Methylomonas methanica TaxID=421 RepID=A0A177MAJ5_METMH|nr:hypothetical protein [Methylomonas methanica]OAI02343.1 hypothetical protein A1353_16250 [Methylomonas methanica]
MKSRTICLASLAVLSACTTMPPKNPENICQIFREKDDWYQASLSSARRWGVPIAVQMAIINQESSFVADAQPPRPMILGIIPWFRASSAYGYPQAKDETWADYQQKAGNSWADREDFADSCDFVAWYCATSNRKLGIPTSDANKLYLTYHEGLGGYQRSSYLSKQWLMNTAQKVHQRALRYDAQLASCRQELEQKN